MLFMSSALNEYPSHINKIPAYAVAQAGVYLKMNYSLMTFAKTRIWITTPART